MKLTPQQKETYKWLSEYVHRKNMENLEEFFAAQWRESFYTFCFVLSILVLGVIYYVEVV